MLWILLCFLSALFAALTSHIDKFLIQKYLKGGSVGSLVIISALMGFPVSILIALFQPEVLKTSWIVVLPVILNGMLYIGWLIPYFYAMKKDEASIITPLFQLYPVLSFGLGYLILGETMTLFQVFASSLILLGSLILVTEYSPNTEIKFHFKKEIYGLMGLVCLFISLNGVLFKKFTLDLNGGFWQTSFWEYIGFSLAAMLLFVSIKSYREEFIRLIYSNKLSLLEINGLNETMAILSKMILNLASLFTSVAMVHFVSEGFQLALVLVIGIFLTLFFPKISKENIKKRYLIQKISSIIIMLFGTYLLLEK